LGLESFREVSRAYLDDVLVIQFRGFFLKTGASRHLEAEEGTHRFLRGISLLLAFLFLVRGSLRERGGGDSLALLGHNWDGL
jgi:hypothetical protein